jgi:hypothetical protein
MTEESEFLREKDFAEYSEDEGRLAKAIMVKLAHRGPQRPSRLNRPARRRGAAPHAARPGLRPTIRRAGGRIHEVGA